MRKFMQAAIDIAQKGIHAGQTPFGACIVKDGNIVSCCHNSVWLDNDITAHAEINAIRQACEKLKTIDLASCVIYSTCEPCPMCFAACHWANISKIVYGANIDDAQQAGFSELTISNKQMQQAGQSNVEIVECFMADQCKELFSLWHSLGKSGTY
jgi:guanine deaminase